MAILTITFNYFLITFQVSYELQLSKNTIDI